MANHVTQRHTFTAVAVYLEMDGKTYRAVINNGQAGIVAKLIAPVCVDGCLNLEEMEAPLSSFINLMTQ